MQHNLSIHQSSERENKIAIITGGATGLGLAVAHKFVRENIKTILIGRDEVKLKEACHSMGVLADCIKCDLTALNDLPELVNLIRTTYSG